MHPAVAQLLVVQTGLLGPLTCQLPNSGQLLALLLTVSLADAFVARPSSRALSALHMVPKYNGNEWVASSPDEGPEAGYDALQTLLMHGPKPWFSRVFTPKDYEQAVLKFMAGDKCSRIEAQGNMGKDRLVQQRLLSMVIRRNLTRFLSL